MRKFIIFIVVLTVLSNSLPVKIFGASKDTSPPNMVSYKISYNSVKTSENVDTKCTISIIFNEKIKKTI